MQHRFYSVRLAASMLPVLLVSLSSWAAESKVLPPGSSWEVDETTALSRLTIGDGASLSAPQGYSLTLTVNGVETPIEPGSYEGDVVLTASRELRIPFNQMNMTSNLLYRQALYVKDGVYVRDQSVPAALVGGEVTDTFAKDIEITSVNETFGGIVVAGNSSYRIDNPTITLTGNGKNDFAGLGAAIRVGDTSKVTVNNARILSTGAVRGAIWVGDEAEIIVNDSEIETRSGVVPEDYGWSWTKGPDGSGTVMMEVPWMLGIRGNNRATIVTTNGIARYNNTHIKAQAWGAMSTDAVMRGKVYLTNSHVEVVESGYGSFADGQSEIHASGTTFDVATYAFILSGGGGYFTDATVVNSSQNAVMAHNGGTLVVDKGTVFNADQAVFQFKAGGISLLVDDAELNSKSGIILEMMVNDDPNQAGGPPAGMGAPGGGPPGSGAPSGGGPGGGAPGGGPPMAAGPGRSPDVEAIFRNVTLDGDFYNARTALSAMNLSFENATVTGAICSAVGEHAVGPNGEKLVMQDDPGLYYLIGKQQETCAETEDPNGATVQLKDGSRWVVNKTSYLTGLTIADGATISAPQGSTVTLTVNGRATPIAAGDFSGRIVLEISTRR